jgi:hypothetical protein
MYIPSAETSSVGVASYITYVVYLLTIHLPTHYSPTCSNSCCAISHHSPTFSCYTFSFPSPPLLLQSHLQQQVHLLVSALLHQQHSLPTMFIYNIVPITISLLHFSVQNMSFHHLLEVGSASIMPYAQHLLHISFTLPAPCCTHCYHPLSLTCYLSLHCIPYTQYLL